MRFVHFTRRTRTAVDVVQLISCRFNAPNSKDVTEQKEGKSRKNKLNYFILDRIAYLSHRLVSSQSLCKLAREKGFRSMN